MLFDTSLQSLKNLRNRDTSIMQMAGNMLDGRYLKCDIEGHLGPEENGICGHCYRSYEHHSDKEDIELEKLKDHYIGLSKIYGNLERVLLP